MHTSPAPRRPRLPPRLLCALLLLPAIASARIGETLAQCTARYGKPTRQLEGVAVFRKGDLTIDCMFNRSGVCDFITYRNDLGFFSKAELQFLREANTSGPWEQTGITKASQTWITTDKRISAIFSTSDGSLCIFTAAGAARSREDEKARVAEELKGF